MENRLVSVGTLLFFLTLFGGIEISCRAREEWEGGGGALLHPFSHTCPVYRLMEVRGRACVVVVVRSPYALGGVYLTFGLYLKAENESSL